MVKVFIYRDSGDDPIGNAIHDEGRIKVIYTQNVLLVLNILLKLTIINSNLYKNAKYYLLTMFNTYDNY